MLKERVTEFLSIVVGEWNELTTAQKVGLVTTFLAVFTSTGYAVKTGIWFMNPFDPKTWAGKYLKARLFYGACGTVSAAGMFSLMNK